MAPLCSRACMTRAATFLGQCSLTESRKLHMRD